ASRPMVGRPRGVVNVVIEIRDHAPSPILEVDKVASGVIANGYLRLDPQELVRAAEKRQAALGRSEAIAQELPHEPGLMAAGYAVEPSPRVSAPSVLAALLAALVTAPHPQPEPAHR